MIKVFLENDDPDFSFSLSSAEKEIKLVHQFQRGEISQEGSLTVRVGDKPVSIEVKNINNLQYIQSHPEGDPGRYRSLFDTLAKGKM